LSVGPKLIVHIAQGAEWDAAQPLGSYVPAGYAREGFIHMSTPDHAHLPANAMLSRQTGLVLLWIDAGRLTSELRYERITPDGEEFPHLYGPLNIDAVISVTQLEPWEPGSFKLPPRPR
jgi:uncharacterized protein (DUF952 family)